MKDNFKINITGSGTKDQIIQALKDVITSISDEEIIGDLERDGETQLEDSVLYTELYVKEEHEE